MFSAPLSMPHFRRQRRSQMQGSGLRPYQRMLAPVLSWLLSAPLGLTPLWTLLGLITQEWAMQVNVPHLLTIWKVVAVISFQ
jgi:hypothetical protein